MHLRSLIAGLALLAFLSACDTTLEAPDVASASDGTSKSNVRAKGETITRNMGTPRAEKPEVEIDEDDADQTLMQTANKMIKQGDPVSASILYRRAIGQNPNSRTAIRGLAKLNEMQGRWREALESWRSLAALDEESVEAYRGMGRSLMALGIYAKAVTEFEKALALGGYDDIKTVNLLAMAELRHGDVDKSIATLKKGLDENDDLMTKNNLGFAYVMAGDLDTAIPILEDVAKDSKATAQQRQNLALAYGLAGREDDARNTALQDLPPAAVENNLKTYRLMRDKMLGKAVPVFAPAKKLVAKKKAAPVKKETAPEKKEAAPEKTEEKKEPAPEKKPEEKPETKLEEAPVQKRNFAKKEQPKITEDDGETEEKPKAAPLEPKPEGTPLPPLEQD